MANTYVAIATTTVGAGGASTIEFTNIPGTYTDLCILLSLRFSAASNWNWSKVEFNGSTTNLSSKGLFQYNNNPGSGNWTSNIFVYQNGNSSNASTFGNMSVYVPNYAGSNAKSLSADYVTELNGADALQGFTAGLWNNTAAITSVKFTPESGTYNQYSTATLYGIKNS